jgi:hypothetical protein
VLDVLARCARSARSRVGPSALLSPSCRVFSRTAVSNVPTRRIEVAPPHCVRRMLAERLVASLRNWQADLFFVVFARGIPACAERARERARRRTTGGLHAVAAATVRVEALRPAASRRTPRRRERPQRVGRGVPRDRSAWSRASGPSAAEHVDLDDHAAQPRRIHLQDLLDDRFRSSRVIFGAPKLNRALLTSLALQHPRPRTPGTTCRKHVTRPTNNVVNSARGTQELILGVSTGNQAAPPSPLLLPCKTPRPSP